MSDVPLVTEEMPGEYLDVLECLVVSPVGGTFEWADPLAEWVEAGDELGVVHSLGVDDPVLAHARGRLMGFLAASGERVRSGQPVAWLRRDDRPSTLTGVVP